MAVHVTTTVCPHCGHPTKYAANADGNAATPPTPGDLTVCLCCLGPSYYAHGPFGLTTRTPTQAELEADGDWIARCVNQARLMLTAARGGDT